MQLGLKQKLFFDGGSLVYNGHGDLVKEMKNTPEESRALANQLETLWEAQFATFHYISQPEFIKMHDKNELVTVSKFMYYETYANKICQLKRGSKERLAGLLYDLGKVLPRIFRKDKYDPFEAGEYRDKPLISVLHALGSFFRECYSIVVALPLSLVHSVGHAASSFRDAAQDASGLLDCSL